MQTRHKLALAKAAYRLLAHARSLAGLRDHTLVTRRGIRWALDLNEGIDLTIYLLGIFEPLTVRAYKSLVRDGDTVLDVGANIGAHVLPLAKLVGPTGKVIAFEPTEYAFKKLETNVGLNPDLFPRMVAERLMLVDGPNGRFFRGLYSSWPLSNSNGLHPVHGGRLLDTTGARALSLDEYVEQAGLKTVSFVKIDVDGHECGVLRGGRKTFSRHRPWAIIEIAPYLLSEGFGSLEELLEFFRSLGYDLLRLSGRPFSTDPAAVRFMVPIGASINVIARPR